MRLRDLFRWESKADKRHKELTVLLKNIMSTQAEAAAKITELTNLLAAQTALVNDTNTRVLKIGTETDSLLKNIEDLKKLVESGSGVSPELAAAIEAASVQAGVLKDSVDALSSNAAAGDEKVPDASAQAPEGT